jgi:aconitate hydratase 2/2-methylisocitrate dehydratase
LPSAPPSASPPAADKQQTEELVALLKNPPKGEEAFLVDLITHRVPAGVDDAAKVKAAFLAKPSPRARKPVR